MLVLHVMPMLPIALITNHQSSNRRLNNNYKTKVGWEGAEERSRITYGVVGRVLEKALDEIQCPHTDVIESYLSHPNR